MSLDLNVYVKQISDDLIPSIISKLNEFDMECEMHPDFSFSTQTGFLPFKFKLKNPRFDVLKDKELISGFEFFIEDFNLEPEKQKAQPKPTFAQKFLGKKTEASFYHSAVIDNKLKDSKKVLIFVWHVADSFELRFASLTSAIIAKLTNGACCYPADDIWYNNETIIEDAWSEIKQYEDSLKERDLKYHEFSNWS